MIGDGTATINFLLDVDDNQFDDDGLFAKEITIKTDDADLKLTRSSIQRYTGLLLMVVMEEQDDQFRIQEKEKQEVLAPLLVERTIVLK